MNKRSTTRGLMFLKSKGKVKPKDTKRIERKLLIRTFKHFPKSLLNYVGRVGQSLAWVTWVHKILTWVSWVAWIEILAWVAWVNKILAWVT